MGTGLREVGQFERPLTVIQSRRNLLVVDRNWQVELSILAVILAVLGLFYLKQSRAQEKLDRDRAWSEWMQACRAVPVRDTSADLDGLTTGVYSSSLFLFRHQFLGMTSPIPEEIVTFCQWRTNQGGYVELLVNVRANGVEADYVNGRLVSGARLGSNP